MYIDAKNRRYSSHQFDSIKTANVGKLILQKSRIEQEGEIQIPFRILASNPYDTFKDQWIGKPLPPFALADSQGKLYTNETLHGKVVVINFWSTSCIPCIKEMPLLSQLADRYATQPITFIAPAPEGAVQVQKIVAKRRFTYTVLPEAKAFFTALGVQVYPYHFVVDREGIIRHIYVGASTDPQTDQLILDSEFVAAIEQILKKQ